MSPGAETSDGVDAALIEGGPRDADVRDEPPPADARGRDAANHAVADGRPDGRGPDRPALLPVPGPMAFPGAEGFGADTSGGRGGRVIEVTNLNDTGAGSFRAAVQATGPRIVVFRVSGTIIMASDIEISGDGRSHLTIAGQTSPGGVQLKGPTHGISLTSGVHDVVIRHLRIRPGVPAAGVSSTNAGIMLSGGAANIVVDHVSLEWHNSKQIETYNAATKATFQWNIIAERSAGLGIGYGGNEDSVTFHHNLVAHSVYGVEAAGARTFDFRNNVVYDYFENPIQLLGWTPLGLTAKANIVANHFIPGTGGNRSRIADLFNRDGADGGTRVFSDGNWGPLCPMGCANDWANGFRDGDLAGTPAAEESAWRVSNPFSAPAVTTQPARDVKDTVLFYAGARPRDALDQRIVDDVESSRPGIALTAGSEPWPALTGPAPPPDRDHDGMPDAWELAHGLNPDKPDDGAAAADNGYTNVENYLNGLAGDPVP